MSYFKTDNPAKKRDSGIFIRASTEDRIKAEDLQRLMDVQSTSEVIRVLISEKHGELLGK